MCHPDVILFLLTKYLSLILQTKDWLEMVRCAKERGLQRRRTVSTLSMQPQVLTMQMAVYRLSLKFPANSCINLPLLIYSAAKALFNIAIDMGFARDFYITA